MKWFHRVSLALGIALLLALFWKLGIGDLIDHLRLLGWLWLPLILLEGLGETMHAVGWRRCLADQHRRLPFPRVAMIRQAGMAFNYLTPTAHLGGDVIRGILLSRDGGRTEAAGGVIVGKAALVLSELTFIVSGSLVALILSDLPNTLWFGWATSTALFSSGILCFLFLQRKGRFGRFVGAVQRLGWGGAAVAKITEQLTLVDEQLKTFHRDRSFDFMMAIFFHILGKSVGLAQAWIFLAGVGIPHVWQIGITIYFLGAWFDLIGFIVPAGVGVQEGSRVLIFRALGMTSIKGLTYGVVLRILKAFWAAVGLACYALLVKGSKRLELRDRTPSGTR